MDTKDNLVITIGRQFGSGGREIGRRLATALGLEYYDKELLSAAAKRAGFSADFFERNDERSPSFFNGIISFAFGFNPVNCYAMSNSISDDSLYGAQSEFIRSLAHTHPCVIVGRTADYVLRDHPRLVNIFVHAPIDICVQRTVNRDRSLSPEKARTKIERINKLRADYYNFYTDKIWGAAASYDLTFDTSLLSLDRIVELVKAYVNLRFPDALSQLGE